MTSEFTHLTSDVIQASSSPSSRADLRRGLSAGREEVVAELLIIPGLPAVLLHCVGVRSRERQTSVSFMSLAGGFFTTSLSFIECLLGSQARTKEYRWILKILPPGPCGKV